MNEVSRFARFIVLSALLFAAAAGDADTIDYGLVPIIDGENGQLKGTALQVPGGDQLFALLKLPAYRENLDTLVAKRRGASQVSAEPISLVLEKRTRSSVQVTLIGTAEPLEIQRPGDDLINALRGWNIVTYDDYGGTRLPALRAFPIELTPQQAARLELLPIELPLSEKSPPAGGLLFHDTEMVGLAVQEGPMTWRQVYHVGNGNPAPDTSQRALRALVSLKLHPLSAIERIVSGAKVSAEDLLIGFDWLGGEFGDDQTAGTLELRLRPTHGQKQITEVRVRIAPRYPREHSVDPVYIPMAVTEASGVFRCDVDLASIGAERGYCSLRIEAGSLMIEADVRDALLHSVDGMRYLSELTDLPGHNGNSQNPTFPPDVFPDLRELRCEDTGRVLVRWEDVDSVTTRKSKKLRHFLISAEIRDGEDWTKVKELFVSLNPNAGAPAEYTDPVGASDVLQVTRYRISLETESKSVRHDGSGRYLIYADTDGHIFVRDSSFLTLVTSIDASSMPSVAATLQFDRASVYLYDSREERILRYGMSGGEYLGALRLADFGIGSDHRLTGFAASPLASNEIILFADKVDSDFGRLMRVDVLTKKVLFSKEITDRELSQIGSTAEAFSPYIMYTGFRDDFVLMHGTTYPPVLGGEFEPYALLSGGVTGFDFQYRGERIDHNYFKSVASGIRGFLKPLGYSTSIVVESALGVNPRDKSDFLVVEEPVHFVRESSEPFQVELPVHSSQPPVNFKILLAPEGYDLDAEQRLVLSASAAASLRPDFLLLRVSDQGGQTLDFWVSVDRRLPPYTSTDE